MNTGKPRLNTVDGNATDPRSTVARDLVFALAAVILLAGLPVDAVSAQTEIAMTAEVEVARPPRETVYFPSQYVNQGREIHELAPTF